VNPLNPGKNATKFIKLVQDPKHVDEAWLKEQEAKANPTNAMTPEDLFPADNTQPVNTDTPIINPAVIPPVGTPTIDNSIDSNLAQGVADTMSNSEKIQKIATLAKGKLNATDTQDIKAKILVATGLDFTTQNLDAILTKLQAS
jgi:hypothetical protein